MKLEEVLDAAERNHLTDDHRGLLCLRLLSFHAPVELKRRRIISSQKARRLLEWRSGNYGDDYSVSPSHLASFFYLLRNVKLSKLVALNLFESLIFAFC